MQVSEEATSGPDDRVKKLHAELVDARANIKALTIQINEADAEKVGS